MISRLTGRLLECSPSQIVLDAQGVGYAVHIPLSTFYALGSGLGSTVSVHVHTHVREDLFQLFGFATREERAVFEQLIAIAGVGPRLALAILSGIGVNELRQAVIAQDRERLQRIPGIGRKTAERLLLELGDRLERRLRETGSQLQREAGNGGAPESGLLEDGVSALVNLGYGREVAERAIGEALDGAGSSTTLEQVLKSALGALAR